MLRSACQANQAAKALATASRYQQRFLTTSRSEVAFTTTNKTPHDVSKKTTSAASAISAKDTPALAFNNAGGDNIYMQPMFNARTIEMDELFIGKTGGEIVTEMMLRHGIKHIFGYPGGAILPIFDAIYKSKQFNFILPKHEQSAGHMAEGYARVSGKPGVVLVTSGPGATNMITPLQDALSDGTPMIVFCGQVVTSAIGTNAFQEADIINISRVCTKWNIMVKNVSELPYIIDKAFEIATSGRPGPVLIDLPRDVIASVLRRAVPAVSALPSLPTAAPNSKADTDLTQSQLKTSLTRVAHLIDIAEKPIIYAGQGIILSKGGPEALRQLAEKASIPVTTTLQGLGAFNELDEKSLHMLGIHGAAYANMSIQEADLIIALGARFDDRITANISKFAPIARAAAAKGNGGIVHFEIIPQNVNKVIQATEAIIDDVATNLTKLLPQVQKKSMKDRKRWFDQIKEWKSKWPLDAYESTERPGLIKPQSLIKELSNLTTHRKADTIIATGVGQHQMWTAQHFRWQHPRTIVTSGSLGTMGFGLPSAIGAKVARPDALVIDIDGDASFNMTLTELSTAVQFNIGVKVIILNNEEQGMITQAQNLFYEDRYAYTHQQNPDFMKLADAMGVQHRRLIKPEETTDALKWLIDSDGPALLEVVTDKKVPVLPYVLAGSGLHEFLAFDSEEEKERREIMRQRTGGLYS